MCNIPPELRRSIHGSNPFFEQIQEIFSKSCQKPLEFNLYGTVSIYGMDCGDFTNSFCVGTHGDPMEIVIVLNKTAGNAF
jgi:hypothetical protein